MFSIVFTRVYVCDVQHFFARVLFWACCFGPDYDSHRVHRPNPESYLAIQIRSHGIDPSSAFRDHIPTLYRPSGWADTLERCAYSLR